MSKKKEFTQEGVDIRQACVYVCVSVYVGAIHKQSYNSFLVRNFKTSCNTFLLTEVQKCAVTALIYTLYL